MKTGLAFMVLGILLLAQQSRPVLGRIRIEKAPPGKSRFAPAEIEVWAGDQIHWFNDTAEQHEPGVLRKDGTFVAFLNEPVAAGSVSNVFSPFARIDAKKKMVSFTISYVCGRHRDEQGIIRVLPTP